MLIVLNPPTFSIEENFILLNGKTDEILMELGPHTNESTTPCSTFKIVLSLLGYDTGILNDEKSPIWTFQEGYDDYLESWKEPQTPKSWMKTSCFWYSKLLANQLGMENFQKYLHAFEYGNVDVSGGLTNPFWVNSSLRISPMGQAIFMRKIINRELPVSRKSIEMTKAVLFVEEMQEGWKLFGKSGWSGSIKNQEGNNFEIGWFVGWFEQGQNYFPFAYNIVQSKVNLAQRIPRVKELAIEILQRLNKSSSLTD